MILSKKSMIIYDGIEKNLYNGTFLDRKIISIPIPIKEKDISIFKIHFNSKILQLDKFLEFYDRDIFIFHTCTNVDIYYFQNKSESVNIAKETIFESYLIPIIPKNYDLSLLDGNVSVVNGYVDVYDEDKLYLFIELALILGGDSI
ncbi:hypothetical protein DVW12_17120 [Clostridium botulinum]|nr:hypothetical protein [Clostridium botulinum]